MKILIFYASYGGGHLNAAKSINEYIKNNYKDCDVELIDCMKYVNPAIEKITTAAYREMAKKAPWAWGRIYSDSQKGVLAHISSRSNKILAIKLIIGIIAGFLIDLVVRIKNKGIEEEEDIVDLCEKEHCDCEHGILKSTVKHTGNIFVFIFIFVINLPINSFLSKVF